MNPGGKDPPMPVATLERPSSVPILGVHVHRVTMAEALEHIEGFVRIGGPHQVVTLDSSMCVLADHDPELHRIVMDADLVTPDSAGVLWASRRTGAGLPERVPGVDLVEKLCARSARTGLRIFFLGAAPGIAEAAAERMSERYPGCRIVGAHHGFFSADEDAAVVENIRQASPDVLCVAMGIPKQEKWISRHRHDLHVPVLIGVGGTLDVLSGTVRRAPLWVQRLCLEWLYRLIRDPSKIRKVLILPRFVLMILRGRHRTRPTSPID
jgi:N-acetylglucosaminyldiphosphoundecaprenol N-acetyl-beta-D-mannosaminyltransferase